MACIANCFLLMRSDVIDPHRTTSEPCEHVFGHSRSIEREFTVKGWGQIVNKLHIRFKLMFRNNFKKKKCTITDKGYQPMSSFCQDLSAK